MEKFKYRVLKAIAENNGKVTWYGLTKILTNEENAAFIGKRRALSTVLAGLRAEGLISYSDEEPYLLMTSEGWSVLQPTKNFEFQMI